MYHSILVVLIVPNPFVYACYYWQAKRLLHKQHLALRTSYMTNICVCFCSEDIPGLTSSMTLVVCVLWFNVFLSIVVCFHSVCFCVCIDFCTLTRLTQSHVLLLCYICFVLMYTLALVLCFPIVGLFARQCRWPPLCFGTETCYYFPSLHVPRQSGDPTC